MPKPKRKKSRKRQSPRFYEALSASTIAPAGLPQVGEQLQDAIEVLGTHRRNLSRRAQPYTERLKQAFIHGSRVTFAALEQAWQRSFAAGRYGAQAARTYAPDFASDLGATAA